MNTTVSAEPGAELAAFAEAKMQAPNFDRLAKLYRWMELFTFGPFLSRCRAFFVPELASVRRAVVLGDGDGRFTARLLRANSHVEICAVDASREMLAALLRRAGADASRVCACCADARGWEPERPPYDLVVTHFFLDCLTSEECFALASRVRGAVRPWAVWVVSEFAVPEGWFGQLVARPLVWLLYRAFGLLTGLRIRSLPDHHAAFDDAGFALTRRRARLGGMLVSEMWRSKT